MSSAAQKVLVVAPNWIGDAVMAQPLLRRLRALGQRVTVLAPASLAAVFQAMPEVDETVSTDFLHGSLEWKRRRAMGATLRARGFDIAYVLPNSWKSALIPLFANIPIRIGYRGEWRYGLLTLTLANPAGHQPMVERYAHLARDATQPLSAPVLSVSPDGAARVRERFAIAATDALYVLCPGAEYGPAKRWPTSHFAQLATQLASRPGAKTIVVVGGPGDIGLAQGIVQLTDAPCRVLAGQTSLAEAIALISTATAVVSNDSGLMHIAAALGRPQVAIFGSSDPRHTPPLSLRAQIEWLHLDCSPCFARVCPLGHTRCLHDISADQVYASLNASLAES